MCVEWIQYMPCCPLPTGLIALHICLQVWHDCPTVWGPYEVMLIVIVIVIVIVGLWSVHIYARSAFILTFSFFPSTPLILPTTTTYLPPPHIYHHHYHDQHVHRMVSRLLPRL